MMYRTALPAAFATALAGAALAQNEPTMTIGDKAPPIEIGHWLKGDPVTSFEDGKVYVLEFWATWCGPCVGSMPHLSELQSKYRDYDVTFVGISDEPLQTVVEFLFKTYPRDGKIHNDRTQYTLTTDPDESVKNDYFKAAGRRGIPSAFIIGKDQRVEWIGHPMSMDEPLDQVVRDGWDRRAFKAKYEEAQAQQRQMDTIRRAIRESSQRGNWTEVLAGYDKLMEITDSKGFQTEQYKVIARDMGDNERASKLGRKIVEDEWDAAQTLNELAWFIVDSEGLASRDLELAAKAANRANDLTDHSDPAILDTVARVHYEMALAIQRRAVESAKGTPFEVDLKKTLEKYEGK